MKHGGLETATEELDRLERLVREIKGHSSFGPADLFPAVVIDAASFASDPDLLEPVRLAVEEIIAQHRTLFPPVQLRFYYSVNAAGFTTANEELRLPAGTGQTPNGYLVPLLTFGNLLQNRVPPTLIKPTPSMGIVHGVRDRGSMLGVQARPRLARA